MTRTVARRIVSAALLVASISHATGAAAQPVPKTPAEAYLGYRAALVKAKSLDDVRPWLSKDGVAKLETAPPSEKKMLLEMIQDMSSALTNVKVVSVDVKGEAATLRVEATDVGDKSVHKASVDVVREGGVWKFVKESWGSGQ